MSVGDSLSKFRARGRDNWDKGESSRRFDPRKPRYAFDKVAWVDCNFELAPLSVLSRPLCFVSRSMFY